MSAQCPLFLLDTNVWIDFFDGWRKGHADARRLYNACLAKSVKLLYAVSSSKDLYYALAASLKHAARQANAGQLTHEQAEAANEFAWSCLNALDENATAVGCDQFDVIRARKGRRLHNDYEDNLVVAAAQRAKADLLVTNDQLLLKHSPVATLCVTDALAYAETLGEA